MSIKNLLGRFLFPKHSKFSDALTKAMIVSVKEIEPFHTPSKEFASLWLIAAPMKYFIEVFLEGNVDGDHKLTKIFCDGPMIKADDCLMISQAFLLRHILNIMRNTVHDKFDYQVLYDDITNNMHNGEKLLKLTFDFNIETSNINSTEELFMPYILSILSTQYKDIDELKSGELKHYFDPITMLGLATYTTEYIIDCKNRTLGF